MRIDQRNNGASAPASGGYTTVDRWACYVAQSGKGTVGRNLSGGNGPAGFPYYLGFQSSSAYTPLASDTFEFAQAIEADMISDFQWGTASAQPVTLSFWASSNQAGTFSGVVKNYAQNRSYVFSYPLSANTWTKIVITIPGDTAGTWVGSGNAGALYLMFDLGSGSTNRTTAGSCAGRELSWGDRRRFNDRRHHECDLYCDRRQARNRHRRHAVQSPVARQEHGGLPAVFPNAWWGHR